MSTMYFKYYSIDFWSSLCQNDTFFKKSLKKSCRHQDSTIELFPSRFPPRLKSTHSPVKWSGCDYSGQNVSASKISSPN